MTWASADNHYTVVAFGRNILDDTGYDGASAVYQNQLPTAQPNVTRVIPRQIARSYSLTPPRTYGVELQYRF
jgi:iron complex outermembrane receptor protein